MSRLVTIFGLPVFQTAVLAMWLISLSSAASVVGEREGEVMEDSEDLGSLEGVRY